MTSLPGPVGGGCGGVLSRGAPPPADDPAIPTPPRRSCRRWLSSLITLADSVLGATAATDGTRPYREPVCDGLHLLHPRLRRLGLASVSGSRAHRTRNSEIAPVHGCLPSYGIP